MPPPFAPLWFSHWSAVGLENRPHAIANASIFGHVDGTRETRLSHNPPSNNLPFLLPSKSSILSPPLPSLRSSSPAPAALFIDSCLSSLPNQKSHEQTKHRWTACSTVQSYSSKDGIGLNSQEPGFWQTWQLRDLLRFWKKFCLAAGLN